MKTKRDSHQPKFTLQMTWPQFERLFPDEEACREYLYARRWPDGVKCPRCGKSEQVYKIAQPWKWECANPECRHGNAYRFSLIAGTIFQDTKYPLRTWFWVLFLMVTSKKGISALQVHRMIGSGSYKTAFYMCHHLRAAMKDPEFRELMGIVEVDETYIGGKEANKHKSQRKGFVGTAGKIAVVGAIERGGAVRAKVVQNTDTPTLDSFVREAVSQRVTLLATDEHSGYRLLGKDYNHGTVTHSKGEYVVGAIHTNTIESFWSLLKRGIVGSYHKVSKEHLPAYVSEFEFRFNNRKNPYLFRDTLKRLLSTEPLPFEKLTSKRKAA